MPARGTICVLMCDILGKFGGRNKKGLTHPVKIPLIGPQGCYGLEEHISIYLISKYKSLLSKNVVLFT